ncbi:MAG TPA: type II secretion system protein [Acidobacteriaceae bacterium]|jgi:general secretion pathway protein G|nr:type II secretion system protein [Acidobacteriaceae bacterium]
MTNLFAQYRRKAKQAAGFTLIELMVVMLIMTILMAIAIPSYISAIKSAREAALREDLHTMRDAIEQYTEDKQAAPQSLDDLVQAGYLKSLPTDPMTHRNDTWQPVTSDSLSSIDQSQPGITDVHSGSDQTGSDGTPYSEW